MKTTAEHFKRLLPTLQHLARFPNANREKICARDGVPAADITAALVDMTEGSPTIWDEDCLQEIAGQLGVRVPAYDPNARPHVAPPGRGLPPAAGNAIMPAPTARAAKSLAPNALDVPAWRKGGKGNACLEVAKLLATSDLAEIDACRKVKVCQATWSAFKGRRIGKGPVDRAKLRELLGMTKAPAPAISTDARPAAAEPKAKRKYTRRRLSKAPAAPAGAAAQPGTDGRLLWAETGRGVLLEPPAPTGAGQSMLAELLLAQLTGAKSTAVLGQFRLELDLRLVPLAPR